MRNLVENAVNYTQAGGEVAVAAAVDAETLVVTVTDNGPGIPPEDLGRVFERFYRVDKSRGRPGGTGLGLAIVKHLADLHGGAVRVAEPPDAAARSSRCAAARAPGRRLSEAARRPARSRWPAAMSAEAGIVSTQAQTIWPATPQRTADRRRVAPTPTIAPVIVCVVLTGDARATSR